jgi:hypothetical protein
MLTFCTYTVSPAVRRQRQRNGILERKRAPSPRRIHLYEGNASSIGDAPKLVGSGFPERKAVSTDGFEHEPPKVPLETTVEAFELIAEEAWGIDLGPRAE